MSGKILWIQKIGDALVDLFHYLAFFGIGATIVGSVFHDYMTMMKTGHATLSRKSCFFFIYLELGAMVGIYFKTHRLPVQYLIYILITTLSLHLVVDVRKVADSFQLYLLLRITGAIALLSVAIFILSYMARKYGGSGGQKAFCKGAGRKIKVGYAPRTYIKTFR